MFFGCLFLPQSDAERRANNVQIAGTRAPVVLAQVEQLSGELFVELLDNSGGEAIACQFAGAAVVPEFVSHEWLELEIADPDRVINLKAIAINPEVPARVAHAAFEAVAIRNREFAGKDSERRFQIQPMLEDLPPGKRLLRHLEIVRLKGEVTVGLERDTRADAFIHRAGQVSSDAQDAEHHDIELFVDWRDELGFVPKLRIFARR